MTDFIRVAGGQLNLTVGDVEGNVERILSAMAWAEDLQADVLLLPELAVTGYPPEDLVLRRRLTITGSTLRPRPVAFKGAIAQALKKTVWPWLESGVVKPVIHSVFAATEAGDGLPSGAARAHALMQSGDHVGKIVLTWS